MKTIDISSLEQLDSFAEILLDELFTRDFEGARLITLSGDLGTGKTTLTQLIGKKLGITEPVTSPTFTIEQRYLIENHPRLQELIHIDAYRLESSEDAEQIGLKETLADSKNLIILEWPERLEAALDQHKKLSVELLYDPPRRSASFSLN